MEVNCLGFFIFRVSKVKTKSVRVFNILQFRTTKQL